MEPIRIETDRLLLRPPKRADAPALREFLAQEYVRRYNCLGKLPTVEKLEELLLSEPERQFSLVRRADGKVLGHIGLETDSLRFRMEALSLDYYLGEEHAHKGYMSEALEGLLRYLFLQTGTEVVSARAFTENAASLSLLEKLGFTREGTLRRAVRTYEGRCFDDAVFSLLREEYFTAHPPRTGDALFIKIDRPMGTAHPKHPDIIYPINYGYVPGLIAPDGEEQDAYVLGVDEPLTEFTGRLIAVIHRFDDVEEKWVLAPEGMSFTKKQIVELTHFQEQYYHTEVRT